MSADEVWGDATRQAAAHSRPRPTEFDPTALAEEIGTIVERFIAEVQDRHGASLEAIVRGSRLPSGIIPLGDSPVRLVTEGDGRYSFTTSLSSSDFCVWPDGRWGYFIGSGDEYIPARCVFGYDVDGTYCAEKQAHIFINVPPHLLSQKTAQPLAQCVYAEW